MTQITSQKKFVFIMAVIIIFFLGLTGVYFIFQKKSPQVLSLSPIISNNTVFAVIDLFQNTVHFLDKEYKELGSVVVGQRKDMGFVDGSFAPNGYFYLLTEGNPSSDTPSDPSINIINPSTLKLVKKIKTDIAPANIAVAPNGKAYLTHNFEYTDNTGWAVSVLNTNTSRIVNQLKVPGAPYRPKVYGNNAYIPIIGGGERHFGNSNIIKIDSSDDSITPLLPNDFTEVPPSDFVVEGNKIFAEFRGNYQEKSKPLFQKGDQSWPHFITVIPTNDPYNMKVINTKIEGSIANDFVFSKSDNAVYLSYTLADDKKGQNGLVIIDSNGTIVNDLKIDDSDWNRNTVEVGDNLLIGNASKKSMLIFDKKAGKFSSEIVMDFTPNQIIY